MTVPNSEVVVEMPQTDDDRLFFYTELVIANIPSLISELNSAKNAILSFSERRRVEVRTKLTTIQSLSKGYTSLMNTVRALKAKEAELDAKEQSVLTERNAEFLTVAEYEARQQENYYGNAEAKATSADGCEHRTSSVVIVDDATGAEIAKAKKNVETVEKQRDECKTLVDYLESNITDALENEKERTQLNKEMAEKINEMKALTRENGVRLAILTLEADEVDERYSIECEGCTGLSALFTECEEGELALIDAVLASQQEAIAALRTEIAEKKELHEIEVATFDAAVLTEKAAAEELQNKISALRSTQNELERYAKLQQMEETDRNSLRKRFLSRSSKKIIHEDLNERKLTPEQEDQIRRDHQLVAELAARVAVMEQNRSDAAGVLIQCEDNPAAAEYAVQQLLELLGGELKLDADAIASFEEDTQNSAAMKLNFD